MISRPPRKTLLELMEWNSKVIRMQTNDINHADSLLQLPFQGNCMNWVLGHILSNRDAIARLLKVEPVLRAEELVIYDRGSEALTDPTKASDLGSLLERVKSIEKAISEALNRVEEDALNEERLFGRNRGPLGGRILFLIWHETYHVGQLEFLRQLTGKNDQVI